MKIIKNISTEEILFRKFFDLNFILNTSFFCINIFDFIVCRQEKKCIKFFRIYKI